MISDGLLMEAHIASRYKRTWLLKNFKFPEQPVVLKNIKVMRKDYDLDDYGGPVTSSTKEIFYLDITLQGDKAVVCLSERPEFTITLNLGRSHELCFTHVFEFDKYAELPMADRVWVTYLSNSLTGVSLTDCLQEAMDASVTMREINHHEVGTVELITAMYEQVQNAWSDYLNTPVGGRYIGILKGFVKGLFDDRIDIADGYEIVFNHGSVMRTNAYSEAPLALYHNHERIWSVTSLQQLPCLKQVFLQHIKQSRPEDVRAMELTETLSNAISHIYANKDSLHEEDEYVYMNFRIHLDVELNKEVKHG